MVCRALDEKVAHAVSFIYRLNAPQPVARQLPSSRRRPASPGRILHGLNEAESEEEAAGLADDASEHPRLVPAAAHPGGVRRRSSASSTARRPTDLLSPVPPPVTSKRLPEYFFAEHRCVLESAV